MSEFEPLSDLAAVDAAQGRVNAKGERLYTVSPAYRRHLEGERARLLAGEPVRQAAAPSIAGATGEIGPNGQRGFLGREPDPRCIELVQKLQARKGADGRRFYEHDAQYRADVDASYADALAGQPYTPEAEQLAADLDRVASMQARDAGHFKGVESLPGVNVHRLDPMFQTMASTAKEQGLSDQQFAALLRTYAKGGEE